MYSNNVGKVLSKILKTDKVLDIGGWASPFKRANYVVDILPYESRLVENSYGGNQDCFTKKTWIVHDFGSGKKLPFKDKYFDFVVCSHVLEDLKDPLFVCSEMLRVGKAGYIETPSRLIESVYELEGKGYAGYMHHRWFVEINDSKIEFTFKNHLIHSNFFLRAPKCSIKKMRDSDRIACLFWENDFNFYEKIFLSHKAVRGDLFDFIKKEKVIPSCHYLFLNIMRFVKELVKTFLKKQKKNFNFYEELIITEYHK